MPKNKKKDAPAATIAPPTEHVPSPPTGFAPPKGKIKDAKATKQEERDANDVGSELTTSPSYVDDFTKRAPDAAAAAAALAAAKAWSDERRAAEAWLDYVRTQRNLAWSTAHALTKRLKDEFEVAAKHDPAIVKRYPQTAAFLNVRKAAAEKGAATRKNNKKAAEKAKKAEEKAKKAEVATVDE